MPTNTSISQNDPMPDPGLYIDKEHHQFEQRLVRKFAEKQDIDQMCAENFDMYMNFMVGDWLPYQDMSTQLINRGQVGSTN